VPLSTTVAVADNVQAHVNDHVRRTGSWMRTFQARWNSRLDGLCDSSRLSVSTGKNEDREADNHPAMVLSRDISVLSASLGGNTMRLTALGFALALGTATLAVANTGLAANEISEAAKKKAAPKGKFASVPELDAGSIGSALALTAAGCLLFAERRRRKSLAA
jgi:hypothetical protein